MPGYAGQSAKISASKIYLSIMCDGEPVSVLDIPVLFDGSTAKYDTQNECYTLSASSGTHTVQVGTVTLTISPGTVGLMRPGDTATFKATVSPANLSVIWSVDGPGNLAGNGLTATYTATQAGAVQVAAAVDMTNAGSSVSFTVSEPIVKIRRHRMRDDGTYEIEYHETGAEQVIFSDGETFQAKLDAGKLTGKDGINGKSAYQQAVAAGYTGTEAAFYAALVSMKDAPFLPLSGGTMTGNVVLGTGVLSFSGGRFALHETTGDSDIFSASENGLILSYGADFDGNTVRGVGAPFNPTDGAPKSYVDAETAKCLPLAGGTMTGALNFGSGRAGVYASGALLRFDSDSVSVMELRDGQVTLLDGNTTISGVCSPSLPQDAANKEYVDAELSSKAERKTAAGTLSTTGWTGSAGNWSQAVAVSWMLAADVPKARLTGTTAAQMDAWDTLEPYVDSAAGKVTFYCKQTVKPAVAMSVEIEVIR